ncbi:type II secretion system protein J [Peribacillus asahii]|uniref:PulJ/GspJ family protein n=1 Tax=Peribacillus asahii TaxID=228899 RepID=UPI00382BB383
MRKKYISQQSGVTLIELLAALTISALLIGIVYGIFTYSVQSNNKTQSHINLRQEANLIITEMRKRHQEATANYEICYDELLANELPSKQGLSLEKVSVDDVIIDATHCKQEIDPSKALPVKFTLTDQQNRNQFTIDTVIEGRRNSGSVAVEIEKPDKQSFADYLRATGTFVYVNKLELKGSPNIIGETGTVVIREGLKEINGGGSISIEAKEIYIKGNVSIKNSILGNLTEPVSNIYINGDVDIDGGNSTKIFGYLKYTGDLSVKNNKDVMTHPAEKVNSILSFPAYIPALKEESWYREQEYDSDQTLRDNMKYFGESIEFNNDKKQTYENVIIASKGDISLKNVDIIGILFAPQGKVEIDGSSKFTGIIVANEFISSSGNSQVQFKMPGKDVELPF